MWIFFAQSRHSDPHLCRRQCCIKGNLPPDIISCQGRRDTRRNNSNTSGEEGADHEAEGDGRHGEGEQEDEDQRGVALVQHRTVWTHLKKKIKKKETQ